jgi:hypothetical protein
MKRRSDDVDVDRAKSTNEIGLEAALMTQSGNEKANESGPRACGPDATGDIWEGHFASQRTPGNQFGTTGLWNDRMLDEEMILDEQRGNGMHMQHVGDRSA